MPDGRLRDGNGYSTHPPTVRVRERISKLPPEERAAHKARAAECSAIWAACNRVSRTEKYKRATVNHRRAILLQYISGLFEKRRKKGTQRVGVNEEGIVEQHLKKEATNRKSSESANKEINKVCLRGVAVDQREDVASETMQDTGSMEREDNEPLPFKMSPDSAAHQVHNDQISNSELLLAIRGVEQKVDRLICQFLSYRPPPMQQRSAQVHIPPGFPVSRPGYMGHPTMATESHHEPEGQAPSQDDFFDEGYASASHHSPPTQPVEHPTGFDLLVREQCYEGQAQEKTRGDQRHVLEGVSAERMAFNRQHPGLGSMQGQPPSFFRGDNQPGVYDEANAQCSSGYGFP